MRSTQVDTSRFHPSLRIASLSMLLASLVTPLLAQQLAPAKDDVGEVQVPRTVPELIDLERRVQDSIEQVEPAMVAIGNRFGWKDQDKISMEGGRFASGVIISDDGLILSQYHVSHRGIVDKEDGLTVYGQPGDPVDVVLADGRTMEGVLLGGERSAGISLLKLKQPGPYAHLNVESRGRPALGQWSIMLGHPTGYRPQRGLVARLGRVVYANDFDIVTSCRTQGGDSGGPIIDVNGRMLGLVQDSGMPMEVSQVAGIRARQMPMNFMAAARIGPKLQEIKTRDVVDELWQYHFARQREYAKVTELLPVEASSLGLGLLTTYSSCINRSAETVVEVLGVDDLRVVYGTIVSDGTVVTRASRIKPYPKCRLVNGSVVSAKVVATDPRNDLALLSLDTKGLTAARFVANVPVRRGTFLLAPSKSGQWDIGILSAPTHEDAIALETSDADPTQGTKQTFASAFVHDIPLEMDVLGGPVLNLRGECVGITIAQAGDYGNLALPAQTIKSFIAQTLGAVR